MISFGAVGLVPSMLVAWMVYLPDMISAQLIIAALACQLVLFAILFMPGDHRQLINRLRSFRVQCPCCAERIDLGDPWICPNCLSPHGVGMLGALNPSPPTLGCDRAHCDGQPIDTMQCPRCDAVLQFNSSIDEPAFLGTGGQSIAKFIR